LNFERLFLSRWRGGECLPGARDTAPATFWYPQLIASLIHSVRVSKVAVLVRVLRESTSEQSQYQLPAGLWMNCQHSTDTSFGI
jgi:hypothetical protein